jgi:hypothetical protein
MYPCPWCGKPFRFVIAYVFHRNRCPKRHD